MLINMKKHSKIAIVIGTKAELIKCMPIMLELQERGLDYWFVSTGQHPLEKSCKDFGVKKPDYILSEEPELSTKFWSKVNNSSIVWCFGMIPKIKKTIKKLQPKHVIYHGDTMSTAVASMATSRIFNPFGKKWNNVHLEAGLRSGSLFEPFPEEISRRICSIFSDILLAVSKLSEENLRNSFEVRGKIYNTGNSVIDSVNIIKDMAKKKIKSNEKDFALINIHRHEHLRSKKNMEKIIEIISAIKGPAIWPIHDNTKYYLEKYGLMDKVNSMKNIKQMSLVDYFTFVNFMDNCKYLVTDGGSIQEESLILRKPCVILRHRTERQEGLDSGYNFLTKLDVEYSKRLIKDIESGKIKATNYPNPYGKKGVSKKVVEVLLK